MDKLASVSIKNFEAIVISKQDEGEGLSTKPRDFKHFEVKRVGTTSLVMPSYLVRYSFLRTIYHVEEFIVVYTHQHLVSCEFYSSRNVAVLKVDFSQDHLKFKHMLDKVSFNLSKV